MITALSRMWYIYNSVGVIVKVLCVVIFYPKDRSAPQCCNKKKRRREDRLRIALPLCAVDLQEEIGFGRRLRLAPLVSLRGVSALRSVALEERSTNIVTVTAI